MPKVTILPSVQEALGVKGLGAITAQTGRDMTDEQLEQGVRAALRKVSQDAPSCCIDGRICVHTLAGEQTTPRPSVAGGSSTTAYAGLKMSGILPGLSTETEVRSVNQRLANAGIQSGNHLDFDHARSLFGKEDSVEYSVTAVSSPQATGCGANDKYKTIRANIDANYNSVHTITSAVLIDSFNEDALDLQPVSEDDEYSPSWVLNAINEQNKDANEVLESPKDQPNHGHTEIAVVFNFIEGITIDQNAFFAETGKKIFVVDVWYINKIANALAENDAQRQQLQHAMIAYQAGTYITLCDGSQRIVIVK